MPAFGLLLIALALAAPAGREPIVGLPCENCEAVFEGMPAEPPSRARIGAAGEPGQALLVTGRVRNATGKPVPGIIVYAYQTNARGIYPTSDRSRGLASHRHGKLRGWARTDAEGRYAFDTIRPAGYPDTDLPQHVHMHVIEPGRCTYYIDDVLFLDDPRLTPAQVRRFDFQRGGSGVGRPTLRQGVWTIGRDITLGKNIAGYDKCKE